MCKYVYTSFFFSSSFGYSRYYTVAGTIMYSKMYIPKLNELHAASDYAYATLLYIAHSNKMILTRISRQKIYSTHARHRHVYTINL